MKFFPEWIGRLRRFVVLARRWILGLPPLLDGGSIAGDGAAPPMPPRGPAPRSGGHRSGSTASARSYLDRFGRLRAAADDPVVEKLRRRAVNELFDWLGLILVPRQIWAILERVGDPGVAIEQLILGLGCDPGRVRQRDADEIDRLQTAIDILVALDTLRPYLSHEHLQEIEYLLFGGDYETVGKYSRIVSALSAVLIAREKSASLRVFGVYKIFIADIERYIRDPLKLEPDEADEALRVSDGLITAMENYAVLHESVSGMIGAILSVWPDELGSGHEVDLREGMILRFEEIDATLMNDAPLGLAGIETLIEECSFLLADLKELLHRIDDGPGPDGPGGMSETDEARVFFGFAAGSAPSQEEIKRAWQAVMKEVHPDLAAGITDPKEIARREELSKKANFYRDLLRRRSP